MKKDLTRNEVIKICFIHVDENVKHITFKSIQFHVLLLIFFKYNTISVMVMDL